MTERNLQTIREKWETELRANGYRITGPLRDVMDVIISSPRPLAPMEIFNMVRASNTNIGLVTVYRTIEKLEELHLLDHVHHVNQCQTVFPATQAHQHLIICEGCGRSIYFTGLEIENELQKIANENGYQITGHWLQLSGLCSQCQQNEN